MTFKWLRIYGRIIGRGRWPRFWHDAKCYFFPQLLRKASVCWLENVSHFQMIEFEILLFSEKRKPRGFWLAGRWGRHDIPTQCKQFITDWRLIFMCMLDKQFNFIRKVFVCFICFDLIVGVEAFAIIHSTIIWLRKFPRAIELSNEHIKKKKEARIAQHWFSSVRRRQSVMRHYHAIHTYSIMEKIDWTTDETQATSKMIGMLSADMLIRLDIIFAIVSEVHHRYQQMAISLGWCKMTLSAMTAT